MAKYVIDEKTLTDIADSIRQKKGTTAEIAPENMPSEIAGITGGGEAEDLDAVLAEQEALIAELQDILVKKAAGSGEGITFDDIASLKLSGDVVLSVSAVGAYTFANNDGITSIYAPNVTSIGNYGFYSLNGVKEIYFPLLKTIGTYCLSNLAVTELDLPECTTIGAQSFNACASIASINLPKATAIPNSCLAGTKITTITLPECKSVGNSSLSGSTNLTYVDLPKCTSLVNYALRNSSKLATLILRSETMCTLSNYALNTTAIWNGTGHIYVPSELIASYQVAANWKTIHAKNANTFRALEDYTIDGTITGELDPNKI